MAVSAVVLTKNEEKNIRRCLQSLRWCDEIIIIDDNSNDNTEKIVKDLKAKIFKKSLNQNFSRQRNFGLKKAKHSWVLFIDADEEVTKELSNEIKSELDNKNTNIKGYFLKRKDKFLKKWLRFGETSKIQLLRLASKDAGKWQGRIHETWEIKGETKTLQNPLIHNRDIDLGQFLERIDQYSTIRANQLLKQKKQAKLFQIIIFPLGKFMHNFFLRLGFLDGVHGFILAAMMSLHSFLVRAKLYLLNKVNRK